MISCKSSNGLPALTPQVPARSSRNGPGLTRAQLDGDQLQQLLAVQRHLLQVCRRRRHPDTDCCMASPPSNRWCAQFFGHCIRHFRKPTGNHKVYCAACPQQVDQARAKAVDDVELFSAQLLAERKDRARLQQRVVALESDLVAAAARVAELGEPPRRGRGPASEPSGHGRMPMYFCGHLGGLSCDLVNPASTQQRQEDPVICNA
jgi:hypothetical protein